MHPFIRTVCCLLLCFTGLNGMAGSGSLKPVQSFHVDLQQIQKLDQLLSKSRNITAENSLHSPAAAESTGKICSCEILDLESLNYKHEHVVLLAEKTNHGDQSDYHQAKRRIQQEKKHLKSQFYDKISLVSAHQEPGSCKAMYIKLKSADNHLQLYEILNADIVH